MRRIVCCVLTLVSSVAYAEGEGDDPVEPNRPIGEPNVYVAGGGTFGHETYSFHGFAAEAGMRMGHSILFGRAMASGGNVTLAHDPGHGVYGEGRVGAEMRGCRGLGLICASVGVDLGVRHVQYTHLDLAQPQFKQGEEGDPLHDSVSATLLAPRLTVDGGGRVRVRGVLEVPSYMKDGERVTGLAGMLMLGVGF